MPDPETHPARWLQALATAGRTFFAVIGTAGLGSVAGLAYGAWLASHTPKTAPGDDVLVFIAWVVCLTLYGVIGFIGGLAVALLGLLLTWIVRLAKRIVRGWEKEKAITRPGADPPPSRPGASL